MFKIVLGNAITWKLQLHLVFIKLIWSINIFCAFSFSTVCYQYALL